MCTTNVIFNYLWAKIRKQYRKFKFFTLLGCCIKEDSFILNFPFNVFLINISKEKLISLLKTNSA